MPFKSLKIGLLIVGTMALLASVLYLNGYSVYRWYLDLPPYTHKSSKPTSVMVPMRDGAKLKTDLYLPKGDGPWPTILIRDPYDMAGLNCGLYQRYGYACVHQHVRGRNGSDGDWYPIIHERKDGLDTLDWLLQQPWQNNKIALNGGSYVAMVQWAMADALPPQVKTIMPSVTHGDWYHIVNHRGHFIQGIMTAWAFGSNKSDGELEDMLAFRPAIKASEKFLQQPQQWYQDYLSNPRKDIGLWNREEHVQLRNAYQNTQVPVLMQGRWHDFAVGGQIETFAELPRRSDSLLMISNGAHGLPKNPITDSGKKTSFRKEQIISLNWLAYHLKDDRDVDLPTGYLLQSNADDQWRAFKNWPQVSESKILHFSQLKKSSLCEGGLLSHQAPSQTESVNYSYDPVNPVRSRGGMLQLMGEGMIEQGDDQCQRSDVLTFTSAPFAEGVTLSGSLELTLEAASDRKDSAFSMRLMEVMSDGRVFNIREDISSLSYRSNLTSPEAYQPNSRVEIVFQPAAIEWDIQPGSSLRLDISSSSFPNFNPHPNTQALWASNNHSLIAQQTVFGGVLSLDIRP